MQPRGGTRASFPQSHFRKLRERQKALFLSCLGSSRTRVHPPGTKCFFLLLAPSKSGSLLVLTKDIPPKRSKTDPEAKPLFRTSQKILHAFLKGPPPSRTFTKDPRESKTLSKTRPKDSQAGTTSPHSFQNVLMKRHSFRNVP